MVATPPIWQDPSGATVDIANGGIWTTGAIDALCSDLKALGGADGVSGFAAKPNILVNGGFEFWQRGTSFNVITTALTYTADRWFSQMNGTSQVVVTQDAGNAGPLSTFACSLVFSFNLASTFAQKIEVWQALRGQAVSFSMLVKASVPNGCRIGLYDGTQNLYSAYHPGDSLAHLLTVTGTVSSAATTLVVSLSMEAAGTFTIDNGYLCTGSTPLPGYIPEDPALGLARCQRYYEIIGIPSSQTVVIAGIATIAAQTAYLTVPYKVTKAVAPTVTVASNFTLTNASGQPTAFTHDTTAVVLQLQNTAAGQFTAVSTGATNAITVEANV